MVSEKIIKRLLVLVKSTFVIASWLMYYLYKSERIEYSINVLWRNINEYSLYVFVLLIMVEFFLKDKKQIFLSFICILTAFVLSQNITAEGTKIDSWIDTTLSRTPCKKE